jgi:hypothetical protein
MKKITYFFFAFTVLITAKMNAQVTIGSTANPNVTLEIVGQPGTASIADGLIIPRMTGAQLKAKVEEETYGPANSATFDGTLVYITEPVSNANGVLEYVKSPGYYYFDKSDNKWKGIINSKNATQWFYMPPVPINTEIGVNKTIDLYAKYKKTIEGSEETGTTVKSGNDVPEFSTLQPVLIASDFNYYVVGYDPGLFSNISISSDGVMTYTIANNAVADDESYINIIFVRK